MIVLLFEDMSSDIRVAKVYHKTIKDIIISKKLLYSNMIILVNILGRTNDIWFFDRIAAIAWAIVVQEI